MTYLTNTSTLRSFEIGDFYDGWKKKPNRETFLKSIEQADYIVLAIDEEKNKLIGYITAVSDGVLSAYIPFLEVDKEYQNQGIGTALLEKMLEQVGHLYMVDVTVDKDKAGFYEKADFQAWSAMIKRNYDGYEAAN